MIKVKTVLRFIFLFVSLIVFVSFAQAVTNRKPETHRLHVTGIVKYRCYPGPDGKNTTDDQTHEPCDGKTYQNTVIDKTIELRIAVEATPDNSQELVGSWDETFEFRKRKFEIAITLFKDEGATPYRVRAAVSDDQPTNRQDAVFLETKSIGSLNKFKVSRTSAGTKEEISFDASIAPAN